MYFFTYFSVHTFSYSHSWGWLVLVGMVGAIAAARASGFERVPVLGFDMGGTSTDVFCVEAAEDAALRLVQEQTDIAGLQLLAPRLPIETVAAGGGSVLQRDGDRLRVGPRSAGARPGPACYRAGGPLTITDANLLLGRLQLLLAMSTKESTKAFFYTSQGALLWTQRLMLRLWAYLISQVDAVTFRYQPAVFETLFLLMQRGELDHAALFDAAIGTAGYPWAHEPWQNFADAREVMRVNRPVLYVSFADDEERHPGVAQWWGGLWDALRDP